jgi:hypothetical protein
MNPERCHCPSCSTSQDIEECPGCQLPHEPLYQEIATLKAKLTKLTRLVLLVEPEVSMYQMEQMNVLIWKHYITAFPEEE